MNGPHDVVVRPVRFTDGVAAMRAFLETVGLSARIESTGGRWVDMVAGSGMVALHSAADSEGGVPAGETRLSFECRDSEQLAQTLRRNGFPDAHWVDETYSRTVFVTDPDGVELAADQVQDDLYGYRAVGPEMPDAGTLAVLPVRSTIDQVAMARLLGVLGLRPRSAGTRERWWVLEGAGLVALHATGADESGRTALAFETREPLAAVASRLVAAGYGDAQVGPEDFGESLRVTDPDRQQVVVHHPPQTP